jgi:hypothetical protein
MLFRLNLILLCVLGCFFVTPRNGSTQPFVSSHSVMHNGLPFAVSSALARPPLGGIRCSMASESAIYTKGELIPATITITNDSDVVSKVPLGSDLEGALRLTIERPNGVTVSAPQVVPPRILSRLGTMMLKPNETYSQRIMLNKWHEFGDVGIYKLTWRTVGSKPEFPTCDPETLYIEVGPYNQIRLAEVCENLLTTISSNRSKDIEAAKELNLIKDPLVVKYLDRAQRANPGVEAILIDGLEQIGNRAAAEVLIRILNEASPDSSSFVQARAALEGIAKKKQTPELLDLIRNAINSNLRRKDGAGQKSIPGS